MNKSFPFSFDIYGHITECNDDEHIRDMLEQILFTIPGERVNLPSFGCGISSLVFGTNSNELMAVKQTQIHSQIQQYLGHLIQVNEVKVSTEENRIDILIVYTVYKSQEKKSARFVR